MAFRANDEVRFLQYRAEGNFVASNSNGEFRSKVYEGQVVGFGTDANGTNKYLKVRQYQPQAITPGFTVVFDDGTRGQLDNKDTDAYLMVFPVNCINQNLQAYYSVGQKILFFNGIWSSAPSNVRGSWITLCEQNEFYGQVFKNGLGQWTFFGGYIDPSQPDYFNLITNFTGACKPVMQNMAPIYDGALLKIKQLIHPTTGVVTWGIISAPTGTTPAKIITSSGSFPQWSYTVQLIKKYDSSLSGNAKWVTDTVTISGVTNRAETAGTVPYTYGGGNLITNSNGTVNSGTCKIIPIGADAIVDLSMTWNYVTGNPQYSFCMANSSQ